MKRELGATERMFHKMREYGGMNAYAFAHGISHQSPLNEDQLVESLKTLQHSQPMLLSTTRKSPTSAPVYDTADSVAPRFTFTTDASDDCFQNEIDRIIHQPYQDSELLWQISILQYPPEKDGYPFSIIVGFDHSIADGTVMCHFMARLMEHYEYLQDPQEKIVKLSQLDHLAPSLEQRTQYKLSVADFFQFLPREIMKMMRPPNNPQFDSTVDFPSRRTKILHHQLTKDQSKKLVESAKKNNTTVHGALAAALLFAIARLKDEENKEGNERSNRFSLSSNVSFRRELGIPDDQLGCYISALNTQAVVTDETEFWNLAKQVVYSLENGKKKNLDRSSNVIYEILQRLLSDKFRIGLLNGDTQGRLDTAVLSNIGKLNFDANLDSISFKDIGIGAGQHGFGPCFMVGVATLNDQIGITIHYVQPLHSAQLVGTLLRELKESLLTAMSESTFVYGDSPENTNEIAV